MSATLQEPAQLLYEIEQIKQTKARYFRFLDTQQWTLWRTCFTDDMQFSLGEDPNPVTSSGDAFVAYVAKMLADTVTVHHGHMPEIELTSATTAKGIWAMFDWVEYQREPERSFQGYGHYLEDYEKGIDGRWRIQSLRLTRLRTDRMPKKQYPRLLHGSFPLPATHPRMPPPIPAIGDDMRWNLDARLELGSNSCDKRG